MEASSFLVFCLVIVIFIFRQILRPKRFPPGPWRLPVLGNLLQFDVKSPMKDIQKFAEKYGPVYSLYLGGIPVVFVYGMQAIKEVLVTKGTEFADRSQNPLFDAIAKKKGIVNVPYGPLWKEHRRFTLSTLRTFGLGKLSMEKRIVEETSYLIRSLEEKMVTGASLDPHPFLDNAVSNIICYLVFGTRFEYDDHSFKYVLNLIHENMRMAVGIWAQLYNAFPLARPLPLPHQKIFKNAENVMAFLKKISEEHKKTLVPGQPRDYIDSYLEEMEKQKNNERFFDEESLSICLADLFIAGMETTSLTLLWGLLYMMVFPDIQDKCQKEIDTVLGDKKCLNYEDKAQLPYTLAVIHEIQRFGNIVPLGVVHATIKDTTLSGFSIPKGTSIVTVLSSAHFDETQWKFPHEFNPSNFLNGKGEFVKPDAFLAFSAGPRVCLGENLARMELFLFFTALLQNFQFCWPDDSMLPNLTPQFGLTHVPSPFKTMLKSRK